MRRVAINLFTLALLSPWAGRAQEIAGMVTDHRLPLPGATVMLKRAADSSLIKLGLTASDGKYGFTAIPPGRYFIAVSHLGYADTCSTPFSTAGGEGYQVPALVMNAVARTLRQASVTATRPVIQQRPDMIVVNIAGTINSTGENALDLIRKSPGVTVDNNNNISMSGKTGVQVFIDGRPTWLTGAALAAYLGNLQSASIGSIELIGHPSARYEAAGTGGIINIRLIKDRTLGTNLTAAAGYAIGDYSKYDGNLSFNHRTRRLNFFGDLDYHNAITSANSIYYRTQPDSLFRQRDGLLTKVVSETWHAGIDLFLTRQSTIGILVNGSLVTDSTLTGSRTPIVVLPANRTDRLLVADNRSSGLDDNYNFNANYHYAGSGGRELDLNADYGLYRLRRDQLQPNNYFDSTGSRLLYSHDYNFLSPTDIDIYSGKADYTVPAAKGQLAMGVRVSYVTSTNNFTEYDLGNSVKTLDSLNSNRFNYTENINAVYLNYTRRFPKGLLLEAGLRIENTNSRGFSSGWQPGPLEYKVYDSAYPRHYTDLFPSVSLNWKDWTLSYNRRIDRPEYQDLNPFLFKLDDYIFVRGNTRLQPQYGDALNLSWSSGKGFSAGLSYSHISDLFTTVTDTTDRSKSVNSKVNLSGKDIAGGNFSYSFRFGWYSGFVNVSGFFAHYNADFGPGGRIDESVFNATIVSQHNFQLGRDWTASLSEYLSTPNIWEATLRSHTLWSLDAGLQKKLFAGRATLKAVVTDIFFTMPWAASSNFGGQYLYSAGNAESRQLRVNFTYRFGSTQVKAARRRQTGAEDETGRVSTGSGGIAP
ncbi:MAG TPA: outer membrane beta-barrel protein [Puia sp.]|nr:outer membrane beta-barrel protein [Puia sp.]